jgi:hypothetical protein
MSATFLFLEEIVEGAPGIRRLGGTDGLGAAPAGIARFPLDGHPHREELTFIPKIFLGNAFGDGLGALELHCGIEVPAVLARPQIGFALWTLAFERDFNRRRNDLATKGATQDFLKPRHLHRARTVLRRPGASWVAFGFFARFLGLTLAVAIVIVHVAALAVFSIHERMFQICGLSILALRAL